MGLYREASKERNLKFKLSFKANLLRLSREFIHVVDLYWSQYKVTFTLGFIVLVFVLAFATRPTNIVTVFVPQEIRTIEEVIIQEPHPILANDISITSGFGFRKSPFHTGNKELFFHTGVDYASIRNDLILPWADGSVYSGGYNNKYGRYVTIWHKPYLMTLYGHMSEVHYYRGKQLTRYTPFGRTGSSGYVTGDHVHFEILFLYEEAWYRIDPEKCKLLNRDNYTYEELLDIFLLQVKEYGLERLKKRKGEF